MDSIISFCEPHLTRYKNFLNSRPLRDLKKESGFNIHHIIPTSLGGGNLPDNLIKLTIREHYIAHMILWKGCGGKMSYAFKRMINSASIRFGLTSRQVYHLRKSLFVSKETREKISKTMTGRKYSLELREKLSLSHIGKKLSEETKEKQRTYHRNNPNVFSESTRDKISKGLTGRKLTDESRQKMSNAQKGHPNLALSKPVLCITTGEVYQSASVVKRDTGVSVSNCCIGKTKTAGGQEWKYISKIEYSSFVSNKLPS